MVKEIKKVFFNWTKEVYDAREDTDGDLCIIIDINDNSLDFLEVYDKDEMLEYGFKDLIGKKKVYPFSILEEIKG